MNILYIIPEFKRCGPVNLVFNLVRQLNLHSDINISLIAIRGDLEKNDLVKEFNNIGVSHIETLEKYSTLIEKLKNIFIFSQTADIIHSHCFYPDLFTIFLGRKAKKFTTIHCMIFKDYVLEYGNIRGRIYAFLHLLVFLFFPFNRIICCSQSVKEYTNKYFIFNPFRRKRLLSIANGINHDVFYPVKDRNNLRTQILGKDPTNANRDIFIYTGRIIRRKRVPQLITWFINNILSISNDSLLLIVGDGSEINFCKKIANENKRNIVFLGKVDYIVPLYQISNYFISNSMAEGLPMSVLEAISCGCIPILSKIHPHEEIINNFPNSSVLLKDFTLKNSLTPARDFSSISSMRMTQEYLSIYKYELKII